MDKRWRPVTCSDICLQIIKGTMHIGYNKITIKASRVQRKEPVLFRNDGKFLGTGAV